MKWFGMTFTLALVLSVSTGCSDNKAGDTGDVDDSDTDVDADAGILDLQLDSGTATAGESIGFSLTWLTDEESLPVEEFMLSSDMEDPLSASDDSVMPTVSGAHVLSALATDVNGEEQLATAVLTVEPGMLAILNLSVLPMTVAAGEAAVYEVAGEDLYGNAVDTGEAVIALPDGVTEGDENTLTATVVGDYAAEASLGEYVAQADWTVVAAEPAVVDLILEDVEDLEAGDDTDYEVVVTDAYGNPCDVETSVFCDDESVVVEDDELEFSEDGIFVCQASVAETDLVDEETIIVDGTGPELVVLTPERGTWTMLESVTVSGSVSDAVLDVASLTINGESTEVSGGLFTRALDLVSGVTLIETVATDTDVDDEGEGNRSSDVRAVLQAPTFHDVSEDLANGLVVRMQDDEGGLGRLEALGSELVSVEAIRDELVGLIFSSSTCLASLPSWLGGGCALSGSADGYLNSLSVGSISMDIDPLSSGMIEVSVFLNDVHADWEVVVSPSPDVDGTITATTIRADVLLDPYLSSLGSLVVPVEVVSVSEVGFDVEVSGAWDTIAGWVGVDVDDIVWGELVDAIDDEVRETVPELLGDTLSDLVVEEEIEAMDNTYTLSASIGGLVIDDDGIEVRFKTSFAPEEVLGAAAEVGPTGSPVYSYGLPDWTFATGTSLALGGDFLNQALHGFWLGGMLDQELTDADLGLDMATISLLMPGLDELTMVTTPLLPPVAMPVDDASEADFDLYLGDMLVQIYNGDIDESLLYMELYVSAVAPLDLAAGSGGSELEVSLGEPVVHVDVVYTTDSYTVTRESTEALFADLMPLYLPEITGAVGSIALPEFEGFTLSGLSSSMEGSGEPAGYWTLSGDLD